MKRLARYAGLVVALVALTLAFGLPVSAAPNPDNASHVAQCASMQGGQHVAEHAKMHNGISDCAQMRGPGDMTAY